MASASDPLLWEDAGTNTPPTAWQAFDEDSRWWFADFFPDNDPIVYIGTYSLPASIDIDWEIVTAPFSGAEIIFFYNLGGASPTEINLGGFIATGTISIPVSDPEASFEFGIRNNFEEGTYGGVVALLGPDIPAVAPPATCDELGRATRAYVSAYDRSRVQQARLYRFEKRCLVANFNGAFPPARTIVSATWRTDAPQIGVISDAQISENGRETMVMFASQLGGWANIRVDATLDNGEIYSTVFRVNVREASAYFDDPAIVVGPYSLTVSV